MRWDGLIRLSGDTTHAAAVYRSLYVNLPLSMEAAQARAQMQAMNMPLTAVERKVACRPAVQCETLRGGGRGVSLD